VTTLRTRHKGGCKVGGGFFEAQREQTVTTRAANESVAALFVAPCAGLAMQRLCELFANRELPLAVRRQASEALMQGLVPEAVSADTASTVLQVRAVRSGAECTFLRPA
jgi:hypothetical protein